MTTPRRYRQDWRTTEQFQSDIKDSTKLERKLMAAYVTWLNSRIRDENKYSFDDYSAGNDGEFIEDGKVTCDADFLLRRSGRPAYKIDIKFCKPNKDCFHLKVNQLESYIQNNVAIVNFMGVNTDNPRFCILKPDELAEWLATGEQVKYRNWGNKLCIKFPVDSDHLVWHEVKLSL
jgi:hypothetical protein